MKSIKLVDLFTDNDIAMARKLHEECGLGEFAKRCADEIVQPLLPRINRVTGQGNDAKYLAYMLEHALTQISKTEPGPKGR